MNKLIPIDCLEKELCVLCCIGLVVYEYMTPEARDLFDTLTKQEKQEIKDFMRKKIKKSQSNLTLDRPANFNSEKCIIIFF